ncbi:hypothetical protein [Microcoleus sp. herbarium12]|uniref:hypothetical protein n=1 Tax=Microcoleus sp. herbarium12 TaxID=3055437 RepID=UPI002FD41DFE
MGLASVRGFQSEADTQLPDSLEIRVYEDTPTVKHLVVPANPADTELNELELEAIAGGMATITVSGERPKFRLTIPTKIFDLFS